MNPPRKTHLTSLGVGQVLSGSSGYNSGVIDETRPYSVPGGVSLNPLPIWVSMGRS